MFDTYHPSIVKESSILKWTFHIRMVAVTVNIIEPIHINTIPFICHYLKARMRSDKKNQTGGD